MRARYLWAQTKSYSAISVKKYQRTKNKTFQLQQANVLFLRRYLKVNRISHAQLSRQTLRKNLSVLAGPAGQFNCTSGSMFVFMINPSNVLISLTRNASARRREGYRFVITKDVKNDSYCCYVSLMSFTRDVKNGISATLSGV